MSAAARLWRGAWLALALLAAQGAQAQGYISRKLSAPVPGRVAVVDLGQAAQAPEVTYRGRPVMVLREADGPWIAVVGIPLAARPGSEAISVRVPAARCAALHSISAPKVHGPAHQAEEPAAGHAQSGRPQAHRARTGRADGRLSHLPGRRHAQQRAAGPPGAGPAVQPVRPAALFNGQERNPHSGLDFAAAAGTPIKAPAAGRVVLVGDYFFNGRTVFVDHGQGFISMFCHMSEIDVKVGDEVPRGGWWARWAPPGAPPGRICTGTSA